MRAGVRRGARRRGASALAARRAARRGRPRLDRAACGALLVVLDQFEDYFLYHPDEDGEGTFAVEFPRLVNEPNLRVNFLLSLREDAWAKLDRFEGRIPALFDELHPRRAPRPRRRRGRRSSGPIEEWNRRLPPARSRTTVEPALVEAVIEAAAAGRLGSPRAATAPARRRQTPTRSRRRSCSSCWSGSGATTVAAGAHTLDLARLEALGGAQQIVENHLLDALGKLTPDEQAVAADVFRFLVTRSKTKIAHPASDLAEWTDGPSRRSRPCSRSSAAARAAASCAPSPRPRARPRSSYELFHDVLAEPILDWRRGYEQERAAPGQRSAAVRPDRRPCCSSLVAVFAALGVWALVQRNDATRRRATAAERSSLALASAASEQLAQPPRRVAAPGLEAYRARARASQAARQHDLGARGGAALGRGGDPARRPRRASTASPSARTGTRSPPPATTGRCGSGTCARTASSAASTATKAPSTASPSARTGARSPSAGYDGTVRLWDVPHARRSSAGPCDGHQGAVYGRRLQPGRAHARLRRRRRDGAALGRAHAQAARPTAAAATKARHTASPSARTGARSPPPASTERSWLWDVRRTRTSSLDPLSGGQGCVYRRRASARTGGRSPPPASTGTVRLWDTARRMPARSTHRPRPRARQRRRLQPRRAARSPPQATTGRCGSGTPHAHSRSAASAATTAPSAGVAFSPDGQHARLRRRRRNGAALGQSHAQAARPAPRGHDGTDGVAFSPDGRDARRRRPDGTVRLWDLAQRTSSSPALDGRPGPALRRRRSARTGSTLAVAGDDGTVLALGCAHAQAARPPARPAQGPPTASPSARTGARSPPPAATDGAALGRRARTGSSADPQGPTTATSTASPSARTGTRSPPPATTGPCGSGTCARTRRLGHRCGGQDSRRRRRVQPRRADARHRRPTTARCGSGTSARTASSASPCTATRAPSTASPSARTGARSPPPAPTGRCGSGTSPRAELGQPLGGHSGPSTASPSARTGGTLATAGDDGTVRLWEGILWQDPADLEHRSAASSSATSPRAEWEDAPPRPRLQHDLPQLTVRAPSRQN